MTGATIKEVTTRALKQAGLEFQVRCRNTIVIYRPGSAELRAFDAAGLRYLPGSAKTRAELGRRKCSLQFVEQPAGAALSYLAGLGDVTLETSGLDRETLVRPVTIRLSGATAQDAWDCVLRFAGLVGEVRDGRITVYRVPEPAPETIDGSMAGAVPLEYQYPDGVYNAEALFVADGSIFIVTKDRDEARVYRGDAAGDGSTVEVMELVTILNLGAEVSGADVSWDGSTIAFRGYRTVWMWHRPPGMQVADALVAEPCTAPSPDEVQGESIAFLADGSYTTVSEGSSPDLHVVERGS